ncbi:TetR/AcrR family transcriptional regulator [Sphingomonas ginsenosidivorax]|uniref:TetR/AcrR family transcriptional regulator n=1 Tax=Sphingomonas ginsenosidivorax TaxID=862135 RepID=UPI001F55014C|nr:TetR/AcrR family transcriptional regulator [Sphingomonas ginsenosidivorax]
MDGAQPIKLDKPKRTATPKVLSYNLNGQRLGRKGRDTRDRILAATHELLAGAIDTPISLSAVARQAGLGMTSLYQYFTDLTELLLAVLDPLTAEAEESYLKHLRERWPDDTLNAHCLEFVTALHGFWHRNSMLLHLRNAMADQRDKRMSAQRVRAAQPVILMLVEQMDQDPGLRGTPAQGMATVLYTGIERVVTVATDRILPTVLPGEFSPNVRNFLRAEARLLELGIREFREEARG